MDQGSVTAQPLMRDALEGAFVAARAAVGGGRGVCVRAGVTVMVLERAGQVGGGGMVSRGQLVGRAETFTSLGLHCRSVRIRAGGADRRGAWSLRIRALPPPDPGEDATHVSWAKAVRRRCLFHFVPTLWVARRSGPPVNGPVCPSLCRSAD